MTEKRHQRLEEAINYLVGMNMIDGKEIVKTIADNVDRHPNNVRAAIRGDEKYLTYKFVKTFCVVFGNIISPDWIWDGSGKMVKTDVFNPTTKMLPSDFEIDDKEKMDIDSSIVNNIEKLSKDELVNLVKELMSLHNEQTEMYRMLIRQNEQMIRYGQERFNNITNIIFKNM